MLEGLRDRSRNPEDHEAELACPPLPRELAYLWRVFLKLSARRGSNGFAASPISYLDIDAFCRLTGTSLSPWEIELIEDLDILARKDRTK